MKELKDARLFRQQCYLDGQWADADAGATIAVTNPANDRPLGTVPKMGTAETRRAIAAADARFRPGAPARPRIAPRPAALVRSDARAQERPGADHDGRAGQAARRGAGRDRLRRVVHRMVRRGRQAHLRRHDPRPRHRQAHRRDQAADRRRRRDHAVELPERDDHAQVRARRSPRAAPSSSSRRARRRTRRSRSPSSPSAPAFRAACSTSSPGRRRPSAASSPPTRSCASSPSPAPPRSASC